MKDIPIILAARHSNFTIMVEMVSNENIFFSTLGNKHNVSRSGIFIFDGNYRNCLVFSDLHPFFIERSKNF